LLEGALGADAVWTEGVEEWWALEEATGFATSIKGLSTDGWPQEIHTWIKNARKGTPEIKNVARFVEGWKGWWRGLNPEWRVTVDGDLIREGGEGLGQLRVPGANGFLGVLIGLKWWREKEGETEDWLGEFVDVKWAMTMLR
ncbi:hypothetical protein C8R46DRAFT_860053, partial [Mycena filopes]